MFGMPQGTNVGGATGGAATGAGGAAVGGQIPGLGAGPMLNPFLMGGWGMPAQGAPAAPVQGFNVNVNNEPPEQRYAAQLVQLEHMGFTNKDQNIRALQNSAGNVERAVEHLLQQG